MKAETEWRRTVQGKTIIRLPKTSDRKSHVTWTRVLERVDLNLRIYGCRAWIGPLYRAGSWVDESLLYAGDEKRPLVVLETTQAEPIEPGSRIGGRGRWRELYILWQWQPERGQWREIARCEDCPIDSAPELRQIARRALAQDLWRDDETVEAAADRIHLYLDSECAQLGDRRPDVVAIVYSLITTQLSIEEDSQRRFASQGGLPRPGVRIKDPRKQLAS